MTIFSPFKHIKQIWLWSIFFSLLVQFHSTQYSFLHFTKKKMKINKQTISDQLIAIFAIRSILRMLLYRAWLVLWCLSYYFTQCFSAFVRGSYACTQCIIQLIVVLCAITHNMKPNMCKQQLACRFLCASEHERRWCFSDFRNFACNVGVEYTRNGTNIAC